jgi:enterochelin esterase-like enzyme
MVRTIVLAAVAASLYAEKVPVPKLIDMARTRDAALEQALRDTLGDENVRKGLAVAGEGVEFVWAVDAAALNGKEPLLELNQTPPFRVSKVGGLWVYQGQLKAYTSHRFRWIVEGQPFGGKNDIAAFGPEAYPRPGVAQGKVVGPIVHESKIYPGMKTNFWYHVPAQYTGSQPAAVMVWQDGEKYAEYGKPARLLETLDNLMHDKRIPVMVSILISPGTVGERRWRSIQYDTVTDAYTRYLLEEVVPVVAKDVKLRTDGYSRAIAGESSGAVCAFTAAWFKPTEFSRVLSRIGTYTSIQWKPKGDGLGSELDGGNIYPFAIRKQPKRNIRVWLSDGAEDLENNHGSWPLQNIQMANSLKMREYDFAFRWSLGTHSTAHGNAELPEALTWLWRDYDPSKTAQEFVMDPAEKNKPYWRVAKLNRD